MYRTRRTVKQYNKYKQTPEGKGCPFCDDLAESNILRTTEHSIVIQNPFPYDIWESRTVIDHLMVIPKRHIKSLGELTTEERNDIVNLICEHELKDYNIYSRAANSTQRTIPGHQHTHLIKTVNNQARGTVYLEKPYLLIKF